MPTRLNRVQGLTTKAIFLTGSSGFVGQHFIKDYGNEYQITVAKVRLKNVATLTLNGVDTVLHLGALVHQMRPVPEDEYFKSNFELTKKLADKAIQFGIKHFIYLSTAHVYGEYGNLVDHSTTLQETTPCTPKDAYGKSKLLAENHLLGLASEDFKVSIIRPPMVYGGGAKGNLISLVRLIKIFPFLPFKYSKNKRSIIYVKNLTALIHKVIQERAGGLFLATDSRSVSIQDLSVYIARALGKKVFLFRLPNSIFKILCKIKPNIMTRLYGTLALDPSKTYKKLQFTPPFTTEEGILEMVKSIINGPK